MSKRRRGRPHQDNSRRARLRKARKEARKEDRKNMVQNIPISPDMLFARIGRLDTERNMLLEQNAALQQEINRLKADCGETNAIKVDAELEHLVAAAEAGPTANDDPEKIANAPGAEMPADGTEELRQQAIEARAVGEADAPPTVEQMEERSDPALD